MAKPKKRRPKTVRPTIPGIPVFKALNRPVQQQEDRLARVVADGVHRPLSEAGFGTGAGEWGFHVANRHRPKPIRHLVDYEDQARRELQVLELASWARNCLVTTVEPGMGRELPHVRVYHQTGVVGRRPRVFPEREVRSAKPVVPGVVRRPARVLKRHEYVLGGMTIIYEAWA